MPNDLSEWLAQRQLLSKESLIAEVNVQKVAKADDRKPPIFEEPEQIMQRIFDQVFSVYARHYAGSSDALSDWSTAEYDLSYASELEEEDQTHGLYVAWPGFEPKDVTETETPPELIVSTKAVATRRDKTGDKDVRVCWFEIRCRNVYGRLAWDASRCRVSCFCPSQLQVICGWSSFP